MARHQPQMRARFWDSRQRWLTSALFVCWLVVCLWLSYPSTGHSQTANDGNPKKLSGQPGSDRPGGSTYTINADVALNDYSSSQSGDRFYVTIPNADASKLASGARGRGYENVQVLRQGPNVVLVFYLQPGAKANVNQRSNRLDVVFTTPGGVPDGTIYRQPGGTATLTPTPAPRLTPTPFNTSPPLATNPGPYDNTSGRIAKNGNPNTRLVTNNNLPQVPPARTPPSGITENAPTENNNQTLPEAGTSGPETPLPATSVAPQPGAQAGWPWRSLLGALLLFGASLLLWEFLVRRRARRQLSPAPAETDAALSAAEESSTEPAATTEEDDFELEFEAIWQPLEYTTAGPARAAPQSEPALIPQPSLVPAQAVGITAPAPASLAETSETVAQAGLSAPGPAEPLILDLGSDEPAPDAEIDLHSIFDEIGTIVITMPETMNWEALSSTITLPGETANRAPDAVLEEDGLPRFEVVSFPSAPQNEPNGGEKYMSAEQSVFPPDPRVETEVNKLLAGERYDMVVLDTMRPDARQYIAAQLQSAIEGLDYARRERALGAFATYGYFDDAVRQLTESEAAEQRVAAARLLGCVRDTAGTRPLLAALNDSSSDVRRAAVQALAKVRDPQAAGPLQEYLGREDRVPRALIQFALDACTQNAPATPAPALPLPPTPVVPAPTAPRSAFTTNDEQLRAEAEKVRARVEVEMRQREDELRRQVETQMRAEAEARQRAEKEAAALRAESEVHLRRIAEEEARVKAEAEALQRAAQEAARRRAEEEARRLAARDAQRQAEEEAARLQAEEMRRQLEAQATRRQAEEDARLRAETEARLKAEAELAQLRAQLEAQRQAREDAMRRRAEMEEARRQAEEEARRRAAEEARLLAEAEAQRRLEEARRQAEEEARRQFEEELRRKRAEEEARLQAEAEARLKAEQETARLREEVEARRRAEMEAARRLAEEEARLKAEAEARRQAEEEAMRQRAAEEEARRQAEIEAARRRAEEEARRLAAEETRRQAEAEARLQAEAEARRALEAELTALRAEAEAERLSVEEEIAQLRAEEEAHQRARAEAEATRQRVESISFSGLISSPGIPKPVELSAAEQANQEMRRRLQEELERRQSVETEMARLRAEEEARHQAEEEARRQAEEEARQQAAAAERLQAAEEARLQAAAAAEVVLEVQETPHLGASDWETASDLVFETNTGASLPESGETLTLVDETISFAPEEVVSLEPPQAVVPIALPPPQAPKYVPTYAPTESKSLAGNDDGTIPFQLLNDLESDNTEVRAAATISLARLEVEGDEAFIAICKMFDDPIQSVRDAAARSLYNLTRDRAATFTRALREATPDRRRSIGSSMSSSGLADEAISNLVDESREKTYDAFSFLFLMSKAGEVQPLLRAIKDHPSKDVRLAVVRLLALSGQPEVLPAFRRLAVRGSLPTEVRSAVMEAIFQISSQHAADASQPAS